VQARTLALQSGTDRQLAIGNGLMKHQTSGSAQRWFGELRQAGTQQGKLKKWLNPK